MIIIKKYFKYLGLFGLCMLSFYYTEKVALYVKNKNPIMKTLKEIQETKYVNYINSTIIDDIYIIPGLNGKEINLDKSFSNMHEINTYNEEYLVFNDIKPKVSLEDNKDKIIILDWILLSISKYFDICDIKILLDIPYEDIKDKIVFKSLRHNDIRIKDKKCEKDIVFLVNLSEGYKIIFIS